MTDMRNIDALPSGSYRIRVTYRGQTAKGVASSLEDAIAVRDELRRQIIDHGLVPTGGATAKDLRAKFLGSRNANRDADNEGSRWQHIAASRWYRTALPLITRADGLTWLRMLKHRKLQYLEKQGKRPKKTLGWQTRKHCLNLARAFFDWAIDEGCYGIATNPFLGLTVEREDGDEDEGYQEGWYLDPEEQEAFLAPRAPLRAFRRLHDRQSVPKGPMMAATSTPIHTLTGWFRYGRSCAAHYYVHGVQQCAVGHPYRDPDQPKAPSAADLSRHGEPFGRVCSKCLRCARARRSAPANA